MVIEVLKQLGIFTIGAIVIGWVARFAIKQYFDKELSRYQTELEKERVRFSNLHTERAEITAELYEKLIKFEEDMRSLTDPIEHSNSPPKEEKLKTAAKSGNEFLNFYMKKKIYFPEEICDTIEDLHGEFKEAYNEFGIYRPFESNPNDPVDPEMWLENWERVTEDEVPELKSQLENHFRELLGVK